MAQLRALLRRAGLRRGIDAEAARLRQVLRGDYLHLAAATAQRFVEHPDAAIIEGRNGMRSASASGSVSTSPVTTNRSGTARSPVGFQNLGHVR